MMAKGQEDSGTAGGAGAFSRARRSVRGERPVSGRSADPAS